MDCRVRSPFARSVRSRSARVCPCISRSGAHLGAVFTRYCPINPAAPVMIARGAMVGDLLTRQLPVANAVRLIGFLAQPPLPIRFVLAVVPFEPDHLAVAFEPHDVGCDPV